jgi:hypothetical protein
MNMRLRLALTFAAAAAVAVPPSELLAQVGRQQADRTAIEKAAKAYQPKRLPDGQPDMQGSYTGPDTSRDLDKKALTYGAGERRIGGNVPAYDPIWGVDRQTQGVNQEGARVGTIEGPKIIDPEDQTIPYTPEMQKKKVEVFTGYMLGPKGDVTKIDPMVRCHAQGPPRSNMMLNYNGYHIVQPPGYVIILSETNHLYRAILLDGRPHLTKNIGLYMGDSRGRWEGNTLIVDTTNRVDGGWLDMSGSFHSDALYVVERYTLVGPDRIEYEATITDPKVFLRPWKIASFFDKQSAEYEIYEFACTEGNKAVENLMAEPGSN